MYRTLFAGDLFADLARLQHQLLRHAGPTTPLRGIGRSGFPALNVGTTPTSVEIYAFAPGLAPASIDVSIERGVLTLSGERSSELPQADAKAATHINERISGAYRRAISLPDDIDPESASAAYKDGVLHVSIQRRAASMPRRVEITEKS